LNNIKFWIIGKKCKQYGHSCLGGHGKRNDESGIGVLQQDSEFQKINDPLSNRVTNLLRQLITQRIGLSQRNSPQFDPDVDFDANKLDQK
jgi:hypothetical protein